jgi:hypothetical protein
MPDDAARLKTLDGFVEDLRIALRLIEDLSADAS